MVTVVMPPKVSPRVPAIPAVAAVAIAVAVEAMVAPAVRVAPAIPRSYAEEYPAVEELRPIETIGRAFVRLIIVVAVGTDGRDT